MNQSIKVDVGVLIRRSLFFLVLVILTMGNLFVFFRGMNSPQGMDQAQIAREISRGNGAATKFIRPVAYNQAEEAAGLPVSFTDFKDTYHSPLGPWVTSLVFKAIGAGDPESERWKMGEDELIYPLDRVVAAISTIFFLLALGVNYLLITRIFDAKIAGVCAILMLFCETFWQFSMSGLPQMMMLFWFSCGMYFVYRAVENSVEGRMSMVSAAVAGIFFTLLALTHWVTVWIALGFIIYAAISFRPRGAIGVITMVILMIPAGFVIYRNFQVTGTPFGVAFLTLYNGLANGSEVEVMRITDLGSKPLIMEGLISKILRTSLLQLTSIIPLLAGIVVAPVFFLSLLHPFKSKAIANFRWGILIMWSAGALGLSFFGISDNVLDPNQTHLLFAPLMTAYGIAFITILWSRLDFVMQIPMMRNVHHIVIIGICALPLVLELPRQARIGLSVRDRGGYPHWPPYYAPALENSDGGLNGIVRENEVVFSDQPWAVAWYADRVSIWLPPTKEGFLKLESAALNQQTPIVGVLISPSSHGAENVSRATDLYRDFSAMVLEGKVMQATNSRNISIYKESPKINEIAARYPYRRPMVGLDMIFYSDKVIR